MQMSAPLRRNSVCGPGCAAMVAANGNAMLHALSVEVVGCAAPAKPVVALSGRAPTLFRSAQRAFAIHRGVRNLSAGVFARGYSLECPPDPSLGRGRAARGQPSRGPDNKARRGRGTEGSNPSPSSGESCELRYRHRRPACLFGCGGRQVNMVVAGTERRYALAKENPMELSRIIASGTIGSQFSGR
jgi:hypothetical protein